MEEKRMIKQMALTTRKWRDRILQEIEDTGRMDLAYRPSTGMSSLGWLIAHQAAVYDFSLNRLIQSASPLNPKLFKDHLPGTSGEWLGTPLEEMYQYYDLCEGAFITWIENVAPSEFDRVIDSDDIPKFFRGMTVREVISYMFAHLNHHNGHLSAIKGDILTKRSIHI